MHEIKLSVDIFLMFSIIDYSLHLLNTYSMIGPELNTVQVLSHLVFA